LIAISFFKVELTVSRCRQIVSISSTGLVDRGVHLAALEETESSIVFLLAKVINASDELAQSGLSLGLLLDKLVRLLTRYGFA
jgi:hypothetical protein